MSQHWFPLFLFLVLLPLASPFSQPLKTGPTRPRGGRSGPETGNGNPIDPDEMNLAAAIQDDPVPEAQDDPILNNHAKNETSEFIMQGDIVLHNLYNPMLRNAIRSERQKWPDGVIPYVIETSFDQRERAIIGKAMTAYHEKTCIEFVPRTTQADYIFLMKGGGCYSSIGRVGGRQDVSLGQGCVYTGIVIHELMHAVGFWHEQSREDRDGYIDIDFGNILLQNQFNFQKYPQTIIDHLGVQYDTCSIMHYNAYAFAKDPTKPTIFLKYPSQAMCELGQRSGFSPVDIGKINMLYSCEERKVEKLVKPDTVTPPDEECVDVDKYCSAWAKLGECKSNPDWMLPHCPNSCDSCKVSCRDDNKHCPRWAELGECSKNSAYMNAYCVKSCLCTLKCLNAHKDCEYWASQGFCTGQHAEYMSIKCRKACNFCKSME